jgi:hypothetical protein
MGERAGNIGVKSRANPITPYRLEIYGSGSDKKDLVKFVC